MSASFETVKSVIDTLKATIAVEDITCETVIDSLGNHPLEAEYGEVIGIEISGYNILGDWGTYGEFWVQDEAHPEWVTVGDIVRDYEIYSPQYTLIHNW